VRIICFSLRKKLSKYSRHLSNGGQIYGSRLRSAGRVGTGRSKLCIFTDLGVEQKEDTAYNI